MKYKDNLPLFPLWYYNIFSFSFIPHSKSIDCLDNKTASCLSCCCRIPLTSWAFSSFIGLSGVLIASIITLSSDWHFQTPKHLIIDYPCIFWLSIIALIFPISHSLVWLLCPTLNINLFALIL